MGGGGKPCDMQQACGQSNQQVLSSSKTKVHPVSVSEAAIALKLELLQSVTLGRRGDSVSVAKCGSSCSPPSIPGEVASHATCNKHVANPTNRC